VVALKNFFGISTLHSFIFPQNMYICMYVRQMRSRQCSYHYLEKLFVLRQQGNPIEIPTIWLSKLHYRPV
jgi:hypothetical protein